MDFPQEHPDGVGRQWYELYPPNWEAVPDAIAHLKHRLQALSTLVIPLEKTILMGFSQGGAMALEVATRIKFQAVFAFSSYPHPDWKPLKDMPPIFLCHGNSDQVVPKDASQKSFDILKKNKFESNLYIFEGGHEINKDLIDYCRGIIKQKFLN